MARGAHEKNLVLLREDLERAEVRNELKELEARRLKVDVSPSLLLKEVPSADQLEQGNLFCSGLLPDLTTRGRATRKLHRSMVGAIDRRFGELDRALETLAGANEALDEATLALVMRAREVDPSSAWVTEEVRRLGLHQQQVLHEQALRSMARALDRQIAMIQEPLSDSVVKARFRAMSLDLALRTRALQVARAQTSYAPVSRFHHSVESALTPAQREALKPELAREEKVLKGALAADLLVQSHHIQILLGITGLKQFALESLRQSIRELDEQLALGRRGLELMMRLPDLSEEAVLAAEALHHFESALAGMRRTAEAMEADAETWEGRDLLLARAELVGEGDGPEGRSFTVSVEGAPEDDLPLGVMDRMEHVAAGTLDLVGMTDPSSGKKTTNSVNTFFKSQTGPGGGGSYAAFVQGKTPEAAKGIPILAQGQAPSGGLPPAVLTEGKKQGWFSWGVDKFTMLEKTGEGAGQFIPSMISDSLPGKSALVWMGGALGESAVTIATGLPKGILMLANPGRPPVRGSKGC